MRAMKGTPAARAIKNTRYFITEAMIPRGLNPGKSIFHTDYNSSHFFRLSLSHFTVIIPGMDTHIILLSGGSGKRLWPLSNDIRSKQFLSVLPNGQGGFESMVQRVHRQLRGEFPHERVVIATGAAQKEQIEAQLGSSVSIVCEPARRDTFPAIALSCTYLEDVCRGNADDVVLVLPVDAYADQHYFSIVRRMQEAVENRNADIVLMGITPTSPSSRFGYMLPGLHQDTHIVIDRFVEKPSVSDAERFIAEGACWNGGVFAFRLGYLMDIVRTRIGSYPFDAMLDRYANLDRISFDYAVVENAQSVAMIPYDGTWRDLGTWDMLVGEIGSCGLGPQVHHDTEKTVVVNELAIPVVAVGTDRLVIAASADGILVSDLQKSAQVKPIVDTLTDAPRHMQHTWGTSTVVERKIESDRMVHEVSIVRIEATRTLTLEPDPLFSRTLVVLEGSGTITCDSSIKPIIAGTSVSQTQGASIQIEAKERVVLVESLIFAP